MRRDDKKQHRYLGYAKQINNKFKIRCKQKYVNLNNLEPKLYKILKSVFISNELCNKLISYFNDELSKSDKEKNKKLHQHLIDIDTYKTKQDELTESYVKGDIEKDLYHQSIMKINTLITELKQEINTLNDNKKNEKVLNDCIRLIENLKNIEQNLENSSNNKKSSQLYNALFHIVENSVIDDGNISSYAISQPFNIFKNNLLSNWCR